MEAAKQAVNQFLHHGNKHTVEINQETKPAVLHERVAKQQHEKVTHAVDREVHQHHHQIHVQPIKDHVVEPERHHHNIIPIEHREHHHGKDRDVSHALAAEHGKFRNEQQILPVETTNSSKMVVGEHVHHHVHDYVQPVIERERVVPHVVHTTVPIHEHIEHEPFIHQGNVLPTMTMEEFTKAGHKLKGSRKSVEHIEYSGDPLKIDGKSNVGFGAATGTAAAAGAGEYRAYSGKRSSKSRSSSSSSSDRESSTPRSMRGKDSDHKSSWFHKLHSKNHHKVEETHV